MNRRIFLRNGSMAMLALGFAPGFVVNSLNCRTPCTKEGGKVCRTPVVPVTDT